jgi:CTP-dependent riboflavin kinase
VINNVVIYPNPYNSVKEDLNIKFEITQVSKIIKVQIYTAGFRMIKKITKTDNYSSGEKNLIIESKYLSGLANGTYYIIITAINNTGERVNSKPEILLIIK